MRFAMVGAGEIAHEYLRQQQIDTRIEFVGICARHLAGAQRCAELHGVPAWFDDVTAMYDAVEPEVVVIATPSAAHFAPAMAALSRGIHVICEKPMATTLDDCRAMVDAAELNGVLLRLQSDLTADQLALRAYLTVDELGCFTGAEAEILIPGPPRANWYYDRSEAGGGATLDTLVYPVSMLIGLLGPVVRVAGAINTLIPQRLVGSDVVHDPSSAVEVRSDVDDNATLVLEWAGGQHAVVRALWGTSFSRLDLAVFGRHATLFSDAFGHEAVLHSPRRAVPGGDAVVHRGLADCYRLPARAERRYAGTDLMVDAVSGRRPPSWSGEQQLHVHDVLFSGYLAARSGRRIDLSTSFEPGAPLDPAFYATTSGFL